MGIFKDITKFVKKAAPIIGGGIGFYFGGPVGAMVGGGIGSLLGSEQDKEIAKMRPYPVGKSRLGMGTVGDKSYNLNDPGQRTEYFKEVRKRQGIEEPRVPVGEPVVQARQGGIASLYQQGGEVNGPGTGTSDSVPARLSDGEFVLTAKAMRGAGGGDRDLGAARMYDMMSKLERVA